MKHKNIIFLYTNSALLLLSVFFLFLTASTNISKPACFREEFFFISVVFIISVDLKIGLKVLTISRYTEWILFLVLGIEIEHVFQNKFHKPLEKELSRT